MAFLDGLRGLFAPRAIYYNVGSTDLTVMSLDSASLFRTQPNLQAVVTFLADNIAQLPLKEFERVGENDRKRVRDGANLLLERPNESMTRFELMRATSLDYYIYGRCVWLVTNDDDAPSGRAIYPIPQTWISSINAANGFKVGSVDVLTRDGGSVRIPASELVIFSTYSPTSPIGATSPIEALKQTLQEQMEADKYRSAVWKNGGKASSYIKRPKDVAPWTPEQASAFRRDFKSAWTGNGAEIGGVPVLEDGMEIVTLQFNSRETQWAEAKKLSREDVASIYHVNPSLIWHTDGQTYASAKENARSLYNDTLAPMLQMLQQRINHSLLPMLGEDGGRYFEFDLREKLRGSFEEQAQVIQSSVGGPWLTRNEARAMNNLPAIEGGDELIVPLNVIEGGLASPTDTGTQNIGQSSASAQTKAAGAATEPKMAKSSPSDEDAEPFEALYADHFARMRRSILPKLKAKAAWDDTERWDKELAEDMAKLLKAQVGKRGRSAIEELGLDAEFNEEATENYLAKMSEGRAKYANQKAMAEIRSADDPEDAFDHLDATAKNWGRSLACAAFAFAINDALRQSSMQGRDVSGAMKTWVVTSGNPRASHAAMDGETVPYGEQFSNGMEFPGAWTGEPDETCGCQCEVEMTF